jgi:RNA polymerase sigma factor (sigma-70 family)
MARASAQDRNVHQTEGDVEITVAYESYVNPVRTAVGVVARRNRLTPAEREDLHSELWVRLLDDDGRRLRRFSGRATLETYFATVAQNLLHDMRNRAFGRWRPTVRAQQAGAVAIRLEELIVRDGWTVDAAIEWCRAHYPNVAHAKLKALAQSTHPKARRRPVGPEALRNIRVDGPSPYDVMRAAELQPRRARLNRALNDAVENCSAADRHLLLSRYVADEKVSQIARRLSRRQRVLYRRFETLTRTLKASLTTEGFDSGEVRELIA